MKNFASLSTMMIRLLQLGLVLIPTLEGLLGFLNDLQGSASTLPEVITPLLSMQEVEPEFLHSWRSIHSHLLQEYFYYVLASFEGIVGILALIGLIKMLYHFCGTQFQFIQAQCWGRAACVLGILIWGLGFFVIGGDFFLSWQASKLSYLQTGGLDYALIMFIPYILMKKYESSGTI